MLACRESWVWLLLWPGRVSLLGAAFGFDMRLWVGRWGEGGGGCIEIICTLKIEHGNTVSVNLNWPLLFQKSVGFGKTLILSLCSKLACHGKNHCVLYVLTDTIKHITFKAMSRVLSTGG